MFGMDPVSGLALMVGLVAVVPPRRFASVLMGIPGSSASQATVTDGFPLARKAKRPVRSLQHLFVPFRWIVWCHHPDFLHIDCPATVLAFAIPEMLADPSWPRNGRHPAAAAP